MFSINCHSAIKCKKHDGVKQRKAFDSTIYSRNMCSKSLPRLVGPNTSKRIEIKSTLEAAVGVYDEVCADALVDCSIDHENDEDLPEGWNVTFKLGGNVVRSYTFGWLDKSLVLSEHKRSKFMVEMDMLSFKHNYLSNVDAAALGIILYYPGKCLPGDFVSYRYYPINLSCLGLVLQMMTCVLQALDATEIFSRK